MCMNSPSALNSNDHDAVEHSNKDKSFPNHEVPHGKVRAPRPIRGGGRRRIGDVRTQGVRYVKLPPNPPGLRVASGTAKGRLVKSPSVYLRPMMTKVREALFSMLDTFGIVRNDARVLDLFCGSGSVGIEALSRGMGSATFVDFAPECVQTTIANLARCGFESRGHVICSRVEEFLLDESRSNKDATFDLITITPPYEEVDYSQLMKWVIDSPFVGEGTYVVVEYPVELKTMPPTIAHRLCGIRNRRYGRTMLAVYACQPDVEVVPRPDEFFQSGHK